MEKRGITKTKHDEKIAALKKISGNEKNRYSTFKKAIQTTDISERIQIKLNIINNRTSLLDKNIKELITLLETENIEIDQNVAASVEATTSTVNEIKNITKELTNKTAAKKTKTERVTKKTIQSEEEQMAIQTQKNIEEMEKMLALTKQVHNQRILEMKVNEAARRELIDREIQKMEEIEAKEIDCIDEKIKALQQYKAQKKKSLRSWKK